MAITTSQLRADIYKLFDAVLEGGPPLEVERKGKILRIVADRSANWMDRLPVREGVVNGDPEDLVHMDWSQYWNPGPLDEMLP